ncbi:unnamed protein product [Rhizoctonia solani]|uniref:MACPF-like domain-containing protein n=1 Tax=Rhizoctonia solani TaxID=456999 RepID=A0A8H3CQT2_9AGAM|nr:unnamed protein product [Rhizoctonia solani]
MFDPNPEEPPNREGIPFLMGVFLDPITGPLTLSRPAAILRRSGTNKTTEIDESVTEDSYSQNELDAHHAQLGWPSPNRLPTKPGDASALGGQRTLGTETWASRRFMVQRVTVNISPEDLRPVESFVDAVEAALCQVTNVLQIQALEKVFATWGHVIPLNMVAGACLAVTGALGTGTALPRGIPPSSPPGNPPYNLADVIDRHLGTTNCFGRRLESRVQGGFSEALLNGGYAGWLSSVIENPSSWTVIKVHRVVPITDILDNKLRTQIEQLYTTTFIHRSPAVGTPHGLGFDSTVHGLRTIERIKIWFSDSRIRDISVTYVGGAVTGPYAFGIKNPESQSDVFVLVSGIVTLGK